MLETARLKLQPWQERHRDPFARLHADPIVMADQGGPIERRASDEKFERYRAALQRDGVSRWAVETRDGRFIGYAGVMFRADFDRSLGPHHEIGWRFERSTWGQGFATESARAALDDAFTRLPLEEILSYTSESNLRSQAVMGRLGLRRDPSRDFLARSDGREWRGLVWVASRGQ